MLIPTGVLVLRGRRTNAHLANGTANYDDVVGVRANVGTFVERLGSMVPAERREAGVTLERKKVFLVARGKCAVRTNCFTLH